MKKHNKSSIVGKIILMVAFLFLPLSASAKSMEDLILELKIDLKDKNDLCRLSDFLTKVYTEYKGEKAREYNEIFSSGMSIRTVEFICEGDKYGEKDGLIVADYEHKGKYAYCSSNTMDKKNIFLSFTHPIFNNLLRDSFANNPKDSFFKSPITIDKASKNKISKNITTRLEYSKLVSRGYDGKYILSVSLLYDVNGNVVNFPYLDLAIATKLKPLPSVELPYLEVEGCLAREYVPDAEYIYQANPK